jgi:1-acyl-sn-glycerol-3-phosphate acyltransferase
VLRDGGVVMVFPGGEWDGSRPFYKANTIDFNGRTGYIRTALDAGVPIVPTVSIGGHETQLFLGRGEKAIKKLRLNKIVRTSAIPFSFGFPFGLSISVPPNLPLPSKIVTSVLDPIDPTDGDIAVVDAKVRAVMQAELDVLASQRRFPVIG